MDGVRIEDKVQREAVLVDQVTDESKLNPLGLFYLSLVYVIWGSTYLAIRVTVREGAGFPPFTMGLTRVLVAGILLLLWAMLRRMTILPSRRELLVLGGSGLFLWTGANGLVSWAEQRADSGLAALIIASTPIWVALIETVLERRLPTVRLTLALIVGFAGIVALSLPTLRSGTEADAWSILALLGASASWSAGSMLQSRVKVTVSPQVSAGYQSLIGAAGFLLLVIIFREPKPFPTTQAWLAWGYLVIFGSLIAFTAYVSALHLLPINITMTYAYVNPVIAVLLGAIILGEQITFWTVLGAILVLLGVAGVFRDRYYRNRISHSN
jgi:drug/metabolite transporter (DMT)-like permease